jgi:hypothetical protein
MYVIHTASLSLAGTHIHTYYIYTRTLGSSKDSTDESILKDQSWSSNLSNHSGFGCRGRCHPCSSSRGHKRSSRSCWWWLSTRTEREWSMLLSLWHSWPRHSKLFLSLLTFDGHAVVFSPVSLYNCISRRWQGRHINLCTWYYYYAVTSSSRRTNRMEAKGYRRTWKWNQKKKEQWLKARPRTHVGLRHGW